MSVKDLCPNCVHSETCQTVYQRLGNQSGPSVAAAAFAAFLLPLLVFIAVLAVGRELLPSLLPNSTLQTLVGLLLAASLGFAAMLLTRGLLHSTNKDKTQGALKGE